MEPEFLSMLGFTYKEAEVYLRYVLDTYTEGQDRFDDVWQLIVNNYDGYRFLPEAEPLFNSTILTYFSRNSPFVKVESLVSWWMRTCVRISVGSVA